MNFLRHSFVVMSLAMSLSIGQAFAADGVLRQFFRSGFGLGGIGNLVAQKGVQKGVGTGFGLGVGTGFGLAGIGLATSFASQKGVLATQKGTLGSQKTLGGIGTGTGLGVGVAGTNLGVSGFGIGSDGLGGVCGVGLGLGC